MHQCGRVATSRGWRMRRTARSRRAWQKPMHQCGRAATSRGWRMRRTARSRRAWQESMHQCGRVATSRGWQMRRTARSRRAWQKPMHQCGRTATLRGRGTRRTARLRSLCQNPMHQCCRKAIPRAGGSDREIPTRTLCRACHRALVPVVARCGWTAAGWTAGRARAGGLDRKIPTRTLCGACHRALVPVVARCGWTAGPGGFRCFPQRPIQRGTGRAGSFPCHSQCRRRQEDGRIKHALGHLTRGSGHDDGGRVPGRGDGEVRLDGGVADCRPSSGGRLGSQNPDKDPMPSLPPAAPPAASGGAVQKQAGAHAPEGGPATGSAIPGAGADRAARRRMKYLQRRWGSDPGRVPPPMTGSIAGQRTLPVSWRLRCAVMPATVLRNPSPRPPPARGAGECGTPPWQDSPRCAYSQP
jgi:hypothetical protein